MMQWPTILSGLGLVHYWSIAESFRQYYRLVSKKLLFDTLSYIWVLALGADFACLLAWMLGLSAPDDGSFWEILAIVIAPLPVIIFALFNLFKRGKIKPNSAVDQCIYNAPLNTKNIFALVFANVISFGSMYLFYDKFAEGGACGETSCHIYGWIIGSKSYVFGWLTLYTIGLGFVCSLSALVVLGWVQKSGLKSNAVDR